MVRWIHIALGLTALYGAFLVVRKEQTRRELSVQHRALAAETGYLDITDPGSVHIVALPSDKKTKDIQRHKNRHYPYESGSESPSIIDRIVNLLQQ